MTFPHENERAGFDPMRVIPGHDLDYTTSSSAPVPMSLWGWRWVGTNKAWPVIFGEPPEIPGARWEPIYRAAFREEDASR